MSWPFRRSNSSASAGSGWPSYEEEEERQPLTQDRGSSSVVSSVHQLSAALRRAALGNEDSAAVTRAIGAFRDQVETRLSDNTNGLDRSETGDVLESNAAGDAEGGTGGGSSSTGGRGNSNAGDGGRDGGAVPSTTDVPQGDIQALARWVEDSMPFMLLLLAVFLYRHLLGLITFGWLTSILHNTNERMRRQTLLKENRSRSALLMLFFVLLGHVGFIAALQSWDRQALQPTCRLLSQLQLRRVPDLEAEPPALSALLWDVLMADLAARSCLMLIKTQIALLVPNSSARRLRRLFAFTESAGLVYRSIMPVPLWFHWLYHAAERSGSSREGSIWSLGCAHLYLAFKIVAMGDLLRRLVRSGKAAVCLQLPVGRYASAEEVMERGDEDGCTICQEEYTAPVRLDCGHVFCEECILAWCERSTAATCPLCRAAIPSALGSHSDGSTPLLPQVF